MTHFFSLFQSINLPPEKYMSALSAHLNPALNSSDPSLLKGAYEALAVSAEGCSDHIRKKYLTTFLKYLDSGIKHSMPAVRNAALYALGQFSEYMQPDICGYANEILPVLIHYLDSACNQMQANPGKKAPVGLVSFGLFNYFFFNEWGRTKCLFVA